VFVIGSPCKSLVRVISEAGAELMNLVLDSFADPLAEA